jgi:hypothetical protein
MSPMNLCAATAARVHPVESKEPFCGDGISAQLETPFGIILESRSLAAKNIILYWWNNKHVDCGCRPFLPIKT